MKKLILICVQIAIVGTIWATEFPEKFSIMAWGCMEGGFGFPRLEDKSLFAGMKECGFTCAGFVSPEQLDAVWAAGLRAYVMDPRAWKYKWDQFDVKLARENFRKLARETKNHPAVIGYYLKDEPRTEDFEGLAEMINIVKEFAPGKISYINLYPNYVEKKIIGCSYREYVEKFIQICRPAYLSYDFYGLYTDKEIKIKENPSYVRTGMWENLALFREYSQEYEIPFWVINLATAHWNFRIPTLADLSFQAYSALIYGARGIGHFTYITPISKAFHAGPIAVDGSRNPIWYDVANLNRQLIGMMPLLNQLESTAVYHFPVTQPGQQKPPQDSMITAIFGGHFVVGEFVLQSNGKRYAMILNCDLVNAVIPLLTFRNCKTNVKVVSLTAPQFEQPWQSGMKLAPGGVMLLRFENGELSNK